MALPGHSSSKRTDRRSTEDLVLGRGNGLNCQFFQSSYFSMNLLQGQELRMHGLFFFYV